MDAKGLRIGLVGYGEVGKIFARTLVDRGVRRVVYWDRLRIAPASGVEAASSMADMLTGADLVFSVVTASQAHAVAEEAAPAIRKGTWFVDLNSCSPGTKAESSRIIDAAGGRFVESAVMTSVPPYGIKVPMLLGGTHAKELKALLDPLGFSTQVAAEKIGAASAIKMCRSVVIKGRVLHGPTRTTGAATCSPRTRRSPPPRTLRRRPR